MVRGLDKSKRISWAPDVSLCQVRLFLSEESPSQAGLGTQDHLQAKSSWLSHSSGACPDDVLPPGFEGAPSANQFQITVLDIPQIKWKWPPMFELNPDWHVVAGQESEEAESQNQRELRVLEAVYPRLSAIPPNPVFPMDPEGLYNDNQTPLIPMNPIEDEDASADSMASSNVPVNSQPPSLAHSSNPNTYGKPAADNVEPDLARAAAYAAVAAITKSNEHGSMIDSELLVKILSDPKLIEKLLVDHGTTSTTQNSTMPTTASTSIPLSNAPTPAVPLQNPSLLHVNRMETTVSSLAAATSSGQFYPIQNGHLPNARVSPAGSVPTSSCSVGISQPKDVNYYKNLIQQHGGERQQQAPQQFGNRFSQDTPQQFGNRYGHQLSTNHESINNPRPRDSKPKINKPCMYFNSPRGCRNGANCSFQHDAALSQQQRGTSNSIPEGPAAKRMKMDREISS